jgi:hypothetical protein
MTNLISSFIFHDISFKKNKEVKKIIKIKDNDYIVTKERKERRKRRKLTT